jgi:recombination protein RecT
LKNAILNVASVGLSLNPAEKQAYLVPRDGAVCLDVSYMGLADLATQSASVKWVQAKLVHQNDDYEFQGMGKEPHHKYKSFSDRGPVIGVYCVALTLDGQYLVEEMSLEQCHAIRNRTDIWRKKPNTGPWATDEGEMMKKTVIKRASKLWPKAPKDTRLFKAIDVLNQHEGIDFDAEREEVAAQKEALRLEANNKRQAERDEKDFLISTAIKQLAGDLTAGMTAQDKGKFMREHLGVPAYDHLNRFSLEDLRALAAKLEAMKSPSTETKTNEGESTNGAIIDADHSSGDQ